MRRSRLDAGILVFALSALAGSSTAGAQCTALGAPANCTQTGSVSMTAGRVVRLQLSAGSTTLTAPVPADFDAGFNATTGPTLTVSANAAWTMQLRASTTFWTAANTSPGAPARTNKPAADLTWSKTSNGIFTPLTTTNVTLATGTATASSVTTLFFHTVYGWTVDTPGNYSLAVVLTLTSP